MSDNSIRETHEQQQQQNYCCISHEFCNAAKNNPNKIAVIHAASSSSVDAKDLINHNPPVYGGDRCFTFGDVLRSVDSLSSRLRCVLTGGDDSHLIKPQQTPGAVPVSKCSTSILEPQSESKNLYTPKIVGIYMSPSVEYIVSVLSVLRCGEAFLPLDPSWPDDRLLSIVSSSNADLVIISGCYPLDKKPHSLIERSSCPILCVSVEEMREGCTGSSSFVWPCENKGQRSFCYLMYTSGSTGRPKGVCGTEQGLLNRFLWMQAFHPFHHEELLLFKTAISFIDHLQEFLGAMLATCTLVVPPFKELTENLFSVVNFLEAYSISRLTAVPSLVRAIIPALQSRHSWRVSSSLKLLVLSGEVLPLSLWDMLSNLLPKTSILNLYGSTEVSGDCTFFDCKRLPMILEMENLTSVPIGVPISNCDVVLVGDGDTPTEGEIYVGGTCLSNGYFLESSTVMCSDYVKLHQNSICTCSVNQCGSQLYFKTGDFGRRVQSGDLVFLGRKDRTVKLNGQRVALEEIESVLRGHPDVDAAAVIASNGQGQIALLEAFLVLKENSKSGKVLGSSVRSWMVSKLPLVMIPAHIILIESLPITYSGKVDYAFLEGLMFSKEAVQEEIDNDEGSQLLQLIKKAFSDTLMVEEVSDDDDFFLIGGNSITAAQVSHSLGINMRLLYSFPSPSKLEIALLEKKGSIDSNVIVDEDWKLSSKTDKASVLYSRNSATYGENKNHAVISKRLKMDLDKYVTPECLGPRHGYLWNSTLTTISCSFSRCNKVMCEAEHVVKDAQKPTWSLEIPRNSKCSLHELWKVHMESCIDASPLVVFKDPDIYLFIGSHSHKFLCVNAKSGSVQWEIKLEGRVESSAAIVSDFSQVVVGCYKGKIYFLDFLNGQIRWTFQTRGEVKSQPIIDKHNKLIWCGSHDHNIYALDYRHHHCVYKLPCGGSIFGSPAIDEARGTLHVASTSGRVTAISIKALPFHTLWVHELEVPVFGSLSICSQNGNVICCLVDGHVVALDSRGSIAWRCSVGGPIFAGASLSYTLPSQVLVCSRDGGVYSFELEKGNLLWEYNVGDPITASAYIDEHLQFVSGSSPLLERLVCICASSGTVHLLRINLDIEENALQPRREMVQEFTKLELQGDIFSSPVMIGGTIFVGCRDDYLHCIAVNTESLKEA